MTELPKEWLQEAKNKAGDTLDNTTFEHYRDLQRAIESAEYEYVNGATAYKQAVEKMLNDELPNSKAQEPFIKHLLSKLQTLKPTSND